MSDQMPDGWAAAQLDLLGRLHCGQSPPTTAVNRSRHGSPYVSGPDQWRFGRLVLDKWTTEPKRLVPDGCIFITVKGAGVGTTFLGVRCAIGRDIYAFQPYPHLSKEYLHLALDQDIRTVIGRAAGLIPGLTKEHILAQVIPLPPLNEQHRILAKVEELFGRVNTARARLASVPVILKRFRQAVLAAACSGKLTAQWEAATETPDTRLKKIVQIRKELAGDRGADHSGAADKPDLLWEELPERWARPTLAQVSLLVTDGDHNPPKRVPVGVPHLTAKHIKRGKLVLEGCTFIPESDFERLRRRYEPAPGDIIVTCVGTLGATAIVPPNLRFSADRNLAAVRSLPGVIPEYIRLVLDSPTTQNAIAAASGSTAQPHLYLHDLRKLEIPLPSTAEQVEIVRRVEALFALADTIDRRIVAGAARLENLSTAILSKAFRGELVPTEAELASQEGREYESGAALLERIRKESGIGMKAPSGNGRSTRRGKKGGVRRGT